MIRRHNNQHIESTEGLEQAMCSQTGPRRTFIPPNSAEIHVAADNFRTQSLFSQRSLYGNNVPSVDSDTMVSYFPPKIGSRQLTSIRQQVKQFLEWIEVQCFQEWSLDLRNRMADHGFKPIQSTSHPKYSQTLTAFCFFCMHCPWIGKPAELSVGNIMWAALAEIKSEIRMMHMAEKFLYYSYHCMGRGPTSRDLTFISAECACLKYGLRGGYLHYCLNILQNGNMADFNAASLHFTNPGAFTQVRSLKNIAVSCMPVTSHQPICWSENSDFSSLTLLSVGVNLSHLSIRGAFEKVLAFLRTVFYSYGVPDFTLERFKTICDSPTSTHAGEGLVRFNPGLFPERDAWLLNMQQMTGKAKSDFFNDSYACANHLVVGLHISAGPGFRGTEDASILLVNSLSQAPRNIRARGKGGQLQICIIPEYSKQRPLSMNRPELVAKFLPVDLALLLVRYIFCMKTLEGALSTEVNNCSTFLVTNCGRPIKAESYNQVLNNVFKSLGLGVGLSDLRHALEAFARRLETPVREESALNRNRKYANHSARTSAGYGRDELTVAAIDADILQQDEVASCVWNTVILQSSNRLSDIEKNDLPSAKRRAGELPFEVQGPVVMQARNPSPAVDRRVAGAGCAYGGGSAYDAAASAGFIGDHDCDPTDFPSPAANHDQAVVLPSALDAGYQASQALQQQDLTATLQPRIQTPLYRVQEDSIRFIKAVNEDSLVILPTGSGKTRIVESFGEGEGVVVVISPFQKLGVQLEAVLGESAFRWPLTGCSEALCTAEARFIVVAIEHCEYNSHFFQFLGRIYAAKGISRLFVDEVHHLLEADKPDFRACLERFWMFRSNLISVGVKTMLTGLSATVRPCDVVRLCKFITGYEHSMPVFRRSCFRPSITIGLEWEENDPAAQSACIQKAQLFAKTGKSIIFCSSLYLVSLLAEKLDCQAVTSGTAIDLERFQITRLLVASSCAGHGLDLNDIIAVCILGVPFDAETLIQWSGRIRGAGAVKVFLNKNHVVALSRKQDRRGELAKLFLNIQLTGQNPQEACCHLLDSDIQVPGQIKDGTQQTQGPPVVAPDLKKIVHLKFRINAFLSSFPENCCKVCYILGDRTFFTTCGYVCRKVSGICIRCYQRHAVRDCTAQRLTLTGKALCFKCFLPFLKGVGPDLHPGLIGGQCSSQVCDVLPQAAAVLFYSKSVHIPSRLHGDFDKFVQWLASIDKEAGMHGILVLLAKLVP